VPQVTRKSPANAVSQHGGNVALALREGSGKVREAGVNRRFDDRVDLSDASRHLGTGGSNQHKE
jgi:hypothetical protein